MDRNVPVEETLAALKELVEEGQIGGVGLSEVGAATIRRTHAVYPLRVVEVEFSLWSTDILTNGVASTCKELGIPILTYAPLGYGFLTGQVTKLEDIPKDDIRHMFGQFQPAVGSCFTYLPPSLLNQGHSLTMGPEFPQESRAGQQGQRVRQTARCHSRAAGAGVDPRPFEQGRLRHYHPYPRRDGRLACRGELQGGGAVCRREGGAG